MRALTLTQPWAALVACGAKSYETRSWRPPPSVLGERIAIHAAKGLAAVGGKGGLGELCRTHPFASALAAGGYVWDDALSVDLVLAECSYVIATAVIAGFQQTELVELRRLDEVAFGDYSPGRWAWRLEGVQRLDRPVQVRGALGLWQLPDYVADRVALAGVRSGLMLS